MGILFHAKTAIQHFIARPVPVQAILCIAAILGSVSIGMAYHNTHALRNGNSTTTSRFIIIIPTAQQKQMMLPLPTQPRTQPRFEKQ